MEWTEKYARPGNPLFIAEASRAGAPEPAANALYAFGALDAIGFSPFSIENTPDPATNLPARAYSLLQWLAPLILEHQGRGTIAGVRPPVSFTGEVNDSAQSVVLGNYALRVSFRDPFGPAGTTADHGALIIALAPDEFLVAGTGVTITFQPRGPGAPIAGILDVQEGRHENGRSRAPRGNPRQALRRKAFAGLAAPRGSPLARGRLRSSIRRVSSFLTPLGVADSMVAK